MLLVSAMTDLESKRRKKRRKRVLRTVIAVAAAGGGLLCRFLPEHYQGPCTLAAKVVAFFVGGG